MSDTDGEPVGEQTQGQPGQHQTSTRPSISELLEEPDTRGWIKGVAGTMAFVGVLLGLTVFAMSAFGGTELTQDGQQQSLSAQEQTFQDKQYKFQLVSTVFQMAPYIAFAIAALVGLLVGFNLDGTSRKAMVTAGAAALVGTIALVLLAEIVAATQAPTINGDSYSLDYGQAIVNSLVLGVLAAFMSSGAAWNVRERIA